MSGPVLSVDDVLTWNEDASKRWHELLRANPQALQIPCDIAKAKTAGELLQHIVAVELRYAERLAGQPETDYATIGFSSADEIYATHDRAIAIFRKVLAEPGYDWDGEMEFMTRTLGMMAATRKGILFHTLLHGQRHYAQLATLLRQNGIVPGWPMDYLFLVGRAL